MLPEQSIEFRYDTQLLLDGYDEDLDADDVRDYIADHFTGMSFSAWAVTVTRSSCTFTPMNPGRYWSTAEVRERSMISL